MKELVMFDLDGTLVETGPGILDALRKTFWEKGMEPPAEEILHRFIGPPLTESFHLFAGIAKEQLATMVDTFRKHYQQDGIYRGGPYPGMVETLASLGSRVSLAVATAKPQESAEIVLQYFGLRDYFDVVVGSDLATGLMGKEQIMVKVLAQYPLLHVSKAMMVGDRSFDIEAARSLGMDSVGALYGYGQLDEFAMATYCIEKPSELPEIVWSKKPKEKEYLTHEE